MQPILILDWAIIAVSFFNTIILIWLGATVLLNADRRRWGTWAAGGGLLLGGLFFVGHSAVVGRVIGTFSAEMEFWWRLSWMLVAGAPYMWYLVMLAYTGVLEAGRHRAWMSIVTLLGGGAVALLALTDPLPTYQAIVDRSPVTIFSLAGIPVVILIYPVYSVLCFVLSFSVLRRPEASARFMGDLARQRARPWLMAASLVLLVVSLSIGVAAAWFLSSVQSRPSQLFFLRMLPPLMGFDLLISGMVAVAIVLMGQAIVSYEIFTGKALPRGGLLHYWRQSLVLAAGYGAFVGASLSIPPLTEADSIYRLLLATVLMTVFFALLIWRSYAERERGMDRLRPFVASQRLYERLLRPTAPPDVDVAAPFRALCEDVLGARVAYLAALGPLAPLVGSGLAYPNYRESVVGSPPSVAIDNGQRTTDNGQLTVPALAELAAEFRSPQTMCVPLDPSRYGGAVWAVPLWSERGLIGTLLLGNKRDGGLYTQEEIEIARAAGERLIDTQASTEMARRLMALQRQRLAESQVVDRRTRRVLHDDVLPRLHTAMLMLSADNRPTTNDQRPPTNDRQGDKETRRQGDKETEQSAICNLQSAISEGNGRRTREEAVALLAGVHRQIANLLQDMPATAAPEVAQLGLIAALRRAVDGELGSAFDSVTWCIEPEAEHTVQHIPALNAEVIFYAAREAIRNAARYGRNGDAARPLHLTVSVVRRNGLEIAIEDDGVGMGAAGASAEGSGQGLGLHGTMMAVIGGTLTAESIAGGCTRVIVALPDL
jgi:hypothetical protein